MDKKRNIATYRTNLHMFFWQVRKRGNRRDPNEAGAGHASDTDSALEDSASDSDSEAADTDPHQSDGDADDGRPKKKGNIIIIQDKTICCRKFILCYDQIQYLNRYNILLK
jgi:hypothetical protein